MSKKEFPRPDLKGLSLGGVKLSKKIGSGGFGDVYISPDRKICVKVIFKDAFDNPESYEKEVNAVKFISSCIREQCGIAKFLGSGRTDKNFNYAEPYHPCGGIHTKDFEMYQHFPAIPDSWWRDCKQWKEKTSHDFFYYLMLAADNLVKKPRYCPDTLENRCKRGILKKMSDEEKIQVLAEIIDALLFLYNLEIENESYRNRFSRFSVPEKEVFHITHGDIKPANIFFVNGHAQLGDMGASLQVNPENLSSIGTPDFMLQGFPQAELKKRCGENYFAYSVFSDIYALGKTAEYIMGNGEPAGFSAFSELSRLVDRLQSFYYDKKIQPYEVVEYLKFFRDCNIRYKNHFHKPSYYGTTAPDIRLNNLYDFTWIWRIVEAESVNRFRVTNKTSEWKQYSDILLAERFPVAAEVEIRKKESKMLSNDENDGRPLLIFHLKQSKEIIVLSHSKAPFNASADAYSLLQKDIDKEYRKQKELSEPKLQDLFR